MIPCNDEKSPNRTISISKEVLPDEVLSVMRNIRDMDMIEITILGVSDLGRLFLRVPRPFEPEALRG
jgi:hypothetical protein